jgi:hypothetical protein
MEYDFAPRYDFDGGISAVQDFTMPVPLSRAVTFDWLCDEWDAPLDILKIAAGMIEYEDEGAYVTDLPDEELRLRHRMVVQCTAGFDVFRIEDAPTGSAVIGEIAIRSDGPIFVHRNTTDSYEKSIISGKVEIKIAGIYKECLVTDVPLSSRSSTYKVDGYACCAYFAQPHLNWTGLSEGGSSAVVVTKDNKLFGYIPAYGAHVTKIENVDDTHIIARVEYGGQEYDSPGWQLAR